MYIITKPADGLKLDAFVAEIKYRRWANRSPTWDSLPAGWGTMKRPVLCLCVVPRASNKPILNIRGTIMLNAYYCLALFVYD